MVLEISLAGTGPRIGRRLIQGAGVTSGYIDAVEEMSLVMGFLSGIGFIHESGDDPLDATDAQGVWA